MFSGLIANCGCLQPVLRAVPGYTISTAMGTPSIIDDGGGGDDKEAAAVIGARLFVTPPRGATVANATSSDTAVLTLMQPAACTSCSGNDSKTSFMAVRP